MWIVRQVVDAPARDHDAGRWTGDGRIQSSAVGERPTKAAAMELAEQRAGDDAEFFATPGSTEARVIGYRGASGAYILVER